MAAWNLVLLLYNATNTCYLGTETTNLIDYLDCVTVKRSRARQKEKERKDLYLIRDGEFRIPLLVGSLPIFGKRQN